MGLNRSPLIYPVCPFVFFRMVLVRICATLFISFHLSRIYYRTDQLRNENVNITVVNFKFGGEKIKKNILLLDKLLPNRS